jgi:hypothetical protein
MVDHIGKIYKCSCVGECTAIEIAESDLENPHKELEFCIWKKYPEKRNFFDRLCIAFRIIKNGTLYTDQIILDKSTVKTLVDDLMQWIQKK